MKLHIFGASGSGVTTLGNALSNKLNIPYFDSDDFFWEKSNPPFTVRRDAGERNNLIKTATAQHNDWIVGGSMINWGDNLLPFDLITFLWIPPNIRIERLKQREFGRYGDIIVTNPERRKLYNDFIEWATDYDHDTGISTRTLKAHEAWLKKKSATPIIEIRGNYTTEERIDIIMKHLK